MLDTNELVSAIRSRRGASYQVLSSVDDGRFEVVVSVPLVLEYEYAMMKASRAVRLPKSVVTDILDYLCSVGIRQEIFFLWRPYLRDARDDMVLELAVAASCRAIVTHNTKDFEGSDTFGIHICTPGEFLQMIEAKR